MPSEQQAPAWTNYDHFIYFRMKVSGHSNLYTLNSIFTSNIT